MRPFRARPRCFGVVARAQLVGSVPCVRRHLCVVARERAQMPLQGPSGTFAPPEWGRRARRIAPLRLSGRRLACASTTPHAPRHPSGARILPTWKQNRSRVRAVYYSITVLLHGPRHWWPLPKPRLNHVLWFGYGDAVHVTPMPCERVLWRGINSPGSVDDVQASGYCTGTL